MAAATTPPPPQADHELSLVRVFNAPRSVIFRMWTDPAHFTRWMGPRGFTAQHVQIDLRPGGSWRACLHPENGGLDLWQGGTYHEIVPHERLVFTFAWQGSGPLPTHDTLVTLTFTEQAGKTTMTFHQAAFQSAASRDSHRFGWSSALDRLEEELGNLQSGGVSTQ